MKGEDGNIWWTCICACGRSINVRSDSLSTGNTKSCGCLRNERVAQNGRSNGIELTGKTFGRLNVIERFLDINKPKRRLWLCSCNCGNKKVIDSCSLLGGTTISCGCYGRECASKRASERMGDKSKNWKGGRGIDGNGYIWIKIDKRLPSGGFARKPEHVIVMEKYLGRILLEKETVHHKNGIRDDNRIENLELWSSSHPAGQRIDDKLNWAIEFIKIYRPEILRIYESK